MFRAIRWCLLVFFIVSAAAEAAPILQVSSGLLTGAKGVNVNGSPYDVQFVDGTCNAVFNGCDELADFTFHSQADAMAASLALLQQVFIDGSNGNFDSQPELTFGCVSVIGDVCNVMTGYGFPVGPGFVGIVGAYNAEVEAIDGLSLGLGFPITDSQNSVFDVWARWTLSPQSVPSPGTLSCLGVALLALILVRRRRFDTAYI
ncbi:MAG: hypothetical protein JWN13_509 [Betaproteobacteria bacterium]|nr:hypothetical protein [Betaproteobacteria bacterium]